jgi:hypothetical protein
MDDESYGILPYSEISDLKKEIKKIEENKSSGSEDLLKSIANLARNMDSMLQIFKTAAEEMKMDDDDEKTQSQQIMPMMEKLDEILDQNKILAEGIVALSDLVKERIPEKNITPRIVSIGKEQPNEDIFPDLNVKPNTQEIFRPSSPMPSFQREMPAMPNFDQFQQKQVFPTQPPQRQNPFPQQQQPQPMQFNSDAVPSFDLNIPPPPTPPPAQRVEEKPKKKGLFGF